MWYCVCMFGFFSKNDNFVNFVNIRGCAFYRPENPFLREVLLCLWKKVLCFWPGHSVCLCVCVCVCKGVCVCLGVRVCHQHCDEMAAHSNTVLREAFILDNSSTLQHYQDDPLVDPKLLHFFLNMKTYVLSGIEHVITQKITLVIPKNYYYSTMASPSHEICCEK